MPLPTVEDHRIGEIDEVNSSILLKLRVMQRAAPRDRQRYRDELRKLAQLYIDKVFDFADDLDR